MTCSRTSLAAVFAFATIMVVSPFALADNPKTAASERAFIETSLISAPKRAGDFVLEQSKYDPKSKHAGAGFRYVHPEYKAIRVDVFVFPAGDLPEAEAMTHGMNDFMKSFDAGVQMKYYHDLTVVGREPFVIQPESTSAPDADKDASPELLAALADRPYTGERVDLRYRIHMEDTDENVMMRSRGYLFYKQLYFFKGRISVAESLLDQTTYNALTDQAMRDFVRTIEVRSVGDCARKELTVNPGTGSDQDVARMALEFAQAITKHRSKGCFDTLAKARSAETRDVETITIEYDADDWKSQ